jgi:4-aminobutyrate aminotransferase
MTDVGAVAPSRTPPLPDHTVVPGVWARYTDLDIDHGDGSWLITRDGKRYLDYTSGIGVTNTGHAHPRVAAAVATQAGKLLHGQQNIVYHEPGLRLHERLTGLLAGGPWQAFLANSGTEAVEAAVKLARAATGRPAVVGFRYGFHGRTAQSMALTSAKAAYRSPFEPLPGTTYLADFPYCYRAPAGPHRPEACTCDWEARLDLLFHQVVEPERVAAIIVEPVIGEGGYIVPPTTFLPRLRDLTRTHGILLVADEIQTGFGRTGRFFAVEHVDVEPDILIMAKGIASGLPLAGFVARRELLDRWSPGQHGGTYGGNVVCCAAALATLDVIADEGLVANAVARGTQLLAGLRALAPRHPAIGDVRGLGLMAALELVDAGAGDGGTPAGDGRTPDGELAKRVLRAALDRRLLLLSAGPYGNVVRIIPPLVTTADEIDLALGILDQSLAEAAAAGR